MAALLQQFPVDNRSVSQWQERRVAVEHQRLKLCLSNGASVVRCKLYVTISQSLNMK